MRSSREARLKFVISHKSDIDMYYNARPPSQLVLEGGEACRADAWRQWYAQFTLFLKSSGIHRGGSDVKASLLLELIGPKGYDIFTAFVFQNNEDSQDFDKLVEKFNEYFNPKQNCTLVRYNFFSRSQNKDETIDDYVASLRLLAQKCQFYNLEEGLIKDRVVCGVLSDGTRNALLQAEDLRLEKAVEICRELESPSSKLKLDEQYSEVDEGSSEVKVAVDSRSRRCRRGLTV